MKQCRYCGKDLELVPFWDGKEWVHVDTGFFECSIEAEGGTPDA